MGTINIASNQTSIFSDNVTLTRTEGLVIAFNTLDITLVPSDVVLSINVSLDIACNTLDITMVPSNATLNIFQSVAPDTLNISMVPSAVPKLIINDPSIVVPVVGIAEIIGEAILSNVALGLVESVGDLDTSFAGAQYGIPDQNIVSEGEILGIAFATYGLVNDIVSVGEITNAAVNTVAYFAGEDIVGVAEIVAQPSSGDLRLGDIAGIGLFDGIAATAYAGRNDIAGIAEIIGGVSGVYTLNGIIEAIAELGDIISTVSTVIGDVAGIAEIVSIVTDPDTNTVTISLVLYGKQPQPVMFTNFDFNSFVEIGGKVYGANDSGISMLGGDTDELDKVRSGVRFNESVFGSSRTRKRIRSVYLGPHNKSVFVKGITEKRELEVISDKKGKAIIGRYVNGRNYALEIKDFKELENIDIYLTETT